MRNRVLPFLLGIAVGAVGATQVVNALRQRDAYPRGVMNVMQHHYGLLRHDLRLSHCEAKTTTPEISSLYALAGDLEATFYPDDTPDPPFGEHAQRLRNVLTAAAAATDCPALAPTVDKIGAACEACHQQYR